MRYPEYEVGADLWRVTRWDEFAAEFPAVDQARLAWFHAQAVRFRRAFLIVRRLFGLMPLVPGPDEDPENLRLWSREELAQAMGISGPQMQAELNSIRAATERSPEVPEPPGEDDHAPPAAGPVTPPRAEPDGQMGLSFDGDALLQEFGFPPSMFHVRGRSVEENHAEQTWFTQRVHEWRTILRQAMARSLCEQALRNAMYIRRLEDSLAQLPPADKAWGVIMRQKSDLEEQYRKQVEQLDAIAPWSGAVASKMSFSGVIADVVRGYQEYYAKGENRLLDGIFTLTEIRVELRRAQQAPTVPYRAGLAAYLNAARANLWDAHWKGRAPIAELRALDAAFRAAAAAELDQHGVSPIDLESEDPSQEYPEILESGNPPALP